MEEKEQEKTTTDNKQLDADAIAKIVYTFLKSVGVDHYGIRLVSIRRSYLSITTNHGWIVRMNVGPLAIRRITISGTGKIISVS